MSDSAGRQQPSVGPVLAEHLGLVDAVDHLLNRGAVVAGDATLSLAGVDLVYVGLNVLVSSVETLQRASGLTPAPPLHLRMARGEEGRSTLSGPGRSAVTGATTERPREYDATSFPLSDPQMERGRGGEAGPPEDAARGVARLVLTLVELLRQILERQAIRRMEGGALSDADVERMGTALRELEAKLTELRRLFDLREEDLNVDLGPLGQLL